MDGLTERQINLLISFPIFMLIAIVLGFLILRRDPKYWGNRFFFLSFLCNAVALLFNLLYLFSVNYSFITSLNIASILSVNTGSFFIILGLMVLYYGEQELIENKLTYLFAIIVVINYVILSLIPKGVQVVIIDSSFEPQWTFSFGIYEIVFSQALFTFSFFLGYYLYRELSTEVRKKFKRFLIGIVCINITLLNVSINNMRIIPGYESIYSLLNLSAFLGIILIYFGIVRRSK
ncbi:MAG: hypothetical protein ACTSRS_10905 [Candidatus Helarchaeota archaeon]